MLENVKEHKLGDLEYFIAQKTARRMILWYKMEKEARIKAREEEVARERVKQEISMQAMLPINESGQSTILDARGSIKNDLNCNTDADQAHLKPNSSSFAIRKSITTRKA